MTPESFIAGIMAIAVIFYAVLGGADFGAGVWEFTTSLQADHRDRRLIQEAIGPVWEANHVWLIFAVIIMMNGFPIAFGALSRVLWIPLLLALLGIVFRGAGFVFRAYGTGADSLKSVSGVVFALASTLTPFFLGTCVGAISSAQFEFTATGAFAGDYVRDWLTPMALYSGVLAVGMSAYLAAVFLTREARDDFELKQRWRARALGTGIWIGILAWLGLVMTALEAPRLWHGLLERGWPFILTSMVCGIISLLALRRNQLRGASILSASAVASVICGWVAGQYPHLLPPEFTLMNSKAPDHVLWAMAWTILAGSVLLFPALIYLLKLFKTDLQTRSSIK